MNMLEYFETEAFNELMQFSFGEVREVFNLFENYVLPEQITQFIQEASRIKTWYEYELEKVEEYASGEYAQNINLGIEVPEYDEPQFKAQSVEIQTQRKLVHLITKYFNKDTFQQNKHKMYGSNLFKEEAIETPHELFISLNLHRDRIYSLLSIIGYHQRWHGYFLSSFDYYSICREYSWQVYRINQNLGMKFRFVDVFLSNSRIKPSKSKNKENSVADDYQSNKFIDVDKISLMMLVQPYLKHNTREINKIIEIMVSNLRGRNGGLAWDKVLEQVNNYIAECEAKGIMKRVR